MSRSTPNADDYGDPYSPADLGQIDMETATDEERALAEAFDASGALSDASKRPLSRSLNR